MGLQAYQTLAKCVPYKVCLLCVTDAIIDIWLNAKKGQFVQITHCTFMYMTTNINLCWDTLSKECFVSFDFGTFVIYLQIKCYLALTSNIKCLKIIQLAGNAWWTFLYRLMRITEHYELFGAVWTSQDGSTIMTFFFFLCACENFASPSFVDTSLLFPMGVH